MKKRTLGRTGLLISEIGFGCWAIGGTGYGPTKDSESLDALEAAWESGVNFYDTADTYGHGHSESLLAKFFKNKPRDQFIVASKAGWNFYEGPNHKDFSAAHLTRACEESLKRLQLETLDLYQLHNPTPDLIEKGDAVGVLEKLKAAGKIRFIGISIHTERDGLAALRDPRVDTLQLVLNLMDQRMLPKIFPECIKQNRGIIVREPLACGLLTGKYNLSTHPFDKQDHRRRWMPEKLELDFKKIESIKKILPLDQMTLTRAALEYVLGFEEVSAVIPGAKRRDQILESLQASLEPGLCNQELFRIRELYEKEPIFSKFLP